MKGTKHQQEIFSTALYSFFVLFLMHAILSVKQKIVIDKASYPHFDLISIWNMVIKLITTANKNLSVIVTDNTFIKS